MSEQSVPAPGAEQPPFPDSINRIHYGSWLSGFVDGEGSFILWWHRRESGFHTPCACFNIQLRDDDAPVLRLIQAYWGCGRAFGDRCVRGNSRPKAVYRVNRIPHLNDILLPHFDRFPLLAKKRRDLVIWAEAVRLLAGAIARTRRVRRGQGGARTHWSPEELVRFEALRVALNAQRRYRAPPAVIPAAPLARGGQLELWGEIG